MTRTVVNETERNRSGAEEMYGAAKNGDVDTFFSFISPHVEAEEPDFLPYAGTYQGVERLQTLFATLASSFDLAGLDFERIVANGDYVCAIGRASLANGTGAIPFIERARMKHGEVTHLRNYLYDGASLLGAS